MGGYWNVWAYQTQMYVILIFLLGRGSPYDVEILSYFKHLF